MTYDLDELEQLEKAVRDATTDFDGMKAGSLFWAAILPVAPAIFARLRKLEALVIAARALGECFLPEDRDADLFHDVKRALAALDEDA